MHVPGAVRSCPYEGWPSRCPCLPAPLLACSTAQQLSSKPQRKSYLCLLHIRLSRRVNHLPSSLSRGLAGCLLVCLRSWELKLNLLVPEAELYIELHHNEQDRQCHSREVSNSSIYVYLFPPSLCVCLFLYHCLIQSPCPRWRTSMKGKGGEHQKET